ncbi:hypothetical protein [Pleionea sp. CnH1-48]|uniref:hypothetical protein n=1 Tax=Pleionea sp. CnH1-48 TaxID=2954494 RepID=UPI00209787AB|nr:hypothetical protein [Pleionea sp. CnH1-48]MCO7227026.1 hypothetical protein [Pleionea sp. CnH1-48]
MSIGPIRPSDFARKVGQTSKTSGTQGAKKTPSAGDAGQFEGALSGPEQSMLPAPHFVKPNMSLIKIGLEPNLGAMGPVLTPRDVFDALQKSDMPENVKESLDDVMKEFNSPQRSETTGWYPSSLSLDEDPEDMNSKLFLTALKYTIGGIDGLDADKLIEKLESAFLKSGMDELSAAHYAEKISTEQINLASVLSVTNNNQLSDSSVEKVVKQSNDVVDDLRGLLKDDNISPPNNPKMFI